MRITTNNKYQQPLVTTPYQGNTDGYNTLYTNDDTSQLESANTAIQSVAQDNKLETQERQMKEAQTDAVESQLTGAASSFALNASMGNAVVAEGAKAATVGAKAGAVMSSGFGYGAIAYGVGEVIGNRVDDGDDTTYTGNEKAADFISHAGQGAMMGSYFGPWGAAIGAVGYGLYGLWKGNKDTDKASAEQTKQNEDMRNAITYRNMQQRKMLVVSGSNTGQEIAGE